MWLNIKKFIFKHFIQDYIYIEWSKGIIIKEPQATIRIGKKFATIKGKYNYEKDIWEWKETF